MVFPDESGAASETSELGAMVEARKARVASLVVCLEHTWWPGLIYSQYSTLKGPLISLGRYRCRGSSWLRHAR